MKKSLSIFLMLGLLISGLSLSAQSYQFQHSSLPKLNKKFTIVAHIFRDSLGTYEPTEIAIQNAIVEVNAAFAPIGASFEVCEFRYHENWSHDILNEGNEDEQIVVKYHADYRINIYYLNETASQPFDSETATLNGIQDPFKSSIRIGKVLPGAAFTRRHIRTMGRFFGLMYTFDDDLGSELADGSNCATTGDLICDTPADIFTPTDNLLDFITVDCKRFISYVTDSNGDYYVPDLGNPMSAYPCAQCGFSWEQLKKMADNYLASTPKFW